MRFIKMKYVQIGMQVAKNVQDSNGGVLVRANTILKEVHIDRLRELGYVGVYINDFISKDIFIEDLITYELRIRAVQAIKGIWIEQCKVIAEEIVDEIMNHVDLSLNKIETRAYEDFIFSHSVNVAVYACIIGKGMGFRRSYLGELTLAALLHDIGKMSMPKEILNKKSRLTPEEYKIMKEHALRSYSIIRHNPGISDYVKDAVLHHHENEDGSGYPDGLEGEKQSQYTKILHVADVYDALISKRPYKEPYSPYEAVEYLMGAGDILFDSKVVDSLLRFVPLFPLGTEVELSDGRNAIIYDNKGDHNLRPVVRLFNGNLLDLLEQRNSSIVVKMLDGIENLDMQNSEKERQRMLVPAVRHRILIVDDMLTNLQMLQDILQDQYDTILVKSGQQALNYLEKNGIPDLVLMDIEMPILNGIETVKEIRRKYGAVPVLFITARRDKQTVLECRDLKMSGYIIKPYRATFIRAQIEQILEERA